ncbi:MAG: hypothetical protein PUB12_00760 [[Clostridium] aminophilum]|uniref:hypothetical protein n=1 Tax=[Clostridium] aminophilum TaxID=1526 RepID=UPI0026F261EF|nr:hypothetical protein [[Clostridium] aminophilum]MDD6195426.1 hypothetical protein [[Clostridium] aminophilum]
MAVFNMPNINMNEISSSDNKKTQNYIFQLNEQLKYMFNNLDPDDNYSPDALRKYVRNDERFSLLEQTAGKVNWLVGDGEDSASFVLTPRAAQLIAREIDLYGTVTFHDLADETGRTVYIDGEEITNVTTISGGNIRTGYMLADRIGGGTYTVGGSTYHKTGEIRVLNAQDQLIGKWDKNGLAVYQGEIRGTTIRAGGGTGENGGFYVYGNDGRQIGSWNNNGISITRGEINLNYRGDTGIYVSKDANDDDIIMLGNFKLNQEYGRVIFEAEDENVGMSPYTGDGDNLVFWAGYNDDDDYALIINGDHRVDIGGTLYYQGQELTDLIQSMIDDSSS